MSEPLFIGVDGGATRCRARIVDREDNVVGEARRKASANISSRPARTVLRVILAAIAGAARGHGIAEAEWRRAYIGLGLAGADVVSKREELVQLFRREGFFRGIEVRTDAYATWLGAFDGDDGAILILGTGSCGLAVVRGRESYVSGYGPEVSDEASAHWLGRNAVRRALWAFDGRIERTPLAEEILRRFHDSPEAIIKFANSREATPAAFGALAPIIFDHARERDPLALALVAEAVADAEKMIRRLLDLGASSVYLHGGISEAISGLLRPSVRRYLKGPANLEGISLRGAVLLARRAASRRFRRD
jgi:glucosamine kinase